MLWRNGAAALHHYARTSTTHPCRRSAAHRILLTPACTQENAGRLLLRTRRRGASTTTTDTAATTAKEEPTTTTTTTTSVVAALPNTTNKKKRGWVGLKEAEEGSGKGCEVLFVLFLVARCINHCHDGYFVPEHWFESPSIKFEFNPYFNAKKPFTCCQTWEHLKEGITASKTPTVSVFYPSHSSFNVVDAIAVYSADNCFVDVYGYQLKEGKKNSSTTSIPPAEFGKSFAVKGNPPIQSQDRNGFSLPCGDVIDRFFGESGKYWTPQHWKLLTDTCSKEIGI